MSLHVQYITDQKGHKNAVLVAITDWEKIQHDLKEFETLKKKNVFVEEFKEAIENLKLVKAGKMKARPAKELLDEL